MEYSRTSPEPQKTKLQIKAEPDNCIIVNQPIVRNFSTGGGHGPEDTLIEGDEKLVTKKWQGYPPDKCRLIGKPQRGHAGSDAAAPVPARPCMPRAWYFPNMLYLQDAGQPASPRHREVD